MANAGQRGEPGDPDSRPGLRTSRIRRQMVTGDVDYETKYPLDAYGQELENNARVWRVYDDEAPPADEKEMSGLGKGIDTLLVFAGLFSAVVTTFVAQSSLKLEPDYPQITASLINEVALILRAEKDSDSGNVPRSSLTFDSETYRPTDVWVNGLWLTSLTLSLLTALLSVLAKQWIQAFESEYELTGYSRDLAIMREYRRQGLRQWRVRSIIGFLPVLLSFALLLFLAGLAVYTRAMNSAVSYVVIALTSITVLLYAVSLFLPVFVQSCAYKTPIYDIIVNHLNAPYAKFRRILRLRPGPSDYFRLRELRAALDQEGILSEKALIWLCESSTNNTAISVSLHGVMTCLTDFHARGGVLTANMRSLGYRVMPGLKSSDLARIGGLNARIRAILNRNYRDPVLRIKPEFDVIRITSLMREHHAEGELDMASWRSVGEALDRLLTYRSEVRLHPSAWRDLELAVRYCLTVNEVQPFPDVAQLAAMDADYQPTITMAGDPKQYGPVYLPAYAKARGWPHGGMLLDSMNKLRSAVANIRPRGERPRRDEQGDDRRGPERPPGQRVEIGHLQQLNIFAPEPHANRAAEGPVQAPAGHPLA